MNSINIKQARQQFAKLVGEANRGRSVAITRRGKAVARIAPLKQANQQFPDLAEFRASLGKPTKSAIEQLRKEQRY